MLLREIYLLTRSPHERRLRAELIHVFPSQRTILDSSHFGSYVSETGSISLESRERPSTAIVNDANRMIVKIEIK